MIIPLLVGGLCVGCGSVGAHQETLVISTDTAIVIQPDVEWTEGFTHVKSGDNTRVWAANKHVTLDEYQFTGIKELRGVQEVELREPEALSVRAIEPTQMPQGMSATWALRGDDGAVVGKGSLGKLFSAPFVTKDLPMATYDFEVTLTAGAGYETAAKNQSLDMVSIQPIEVSTIETH